MTRLFYTALSLIFLVAGLVFTLLNQQDVILNFHFVQFLIPVPLLVIVTLIIGVCLGFLAAAGYLFKQRREARQLRKKIILAEQEVQNLREIPIKGDH